MFSFLRSARQSKKVAYGWDRFQQQNAWIAEGEAAGREGKTRRDCPYDVGASSEAWNMWVYGCENELGRIEWEKNGRPMAST